MTEKLSTGPASPSKKREAEKRRSPLNPLREKGKGKEQARVSCETSCSKPARAYARRRLPCTCSYNEAGALADEIDAERIAAAKVLHLDGHNAAGAIAAAKVAREAGVTVMYDAGTHRDGMNELLPLADLLICSEEFILKLTGLKDAEEAVRQVYAKYRPKVCGATMGVRGSMCFDGKDFVKCPAFHVEKVVDTTGCGDLFHTGFAVRWLETHDLLACQRFGAAVSAIKCRGLSGRPPSAPTRAEVENFLSANP